MLNTRRFTIKRSKLTTEKLFVEFYLPRYQALLEALGRSPYPLRSLGDLSTRIFGGPFGSDRKVDMYQASGIPYVRVKDVLPDGIDRAGLTYISREKHEELGRSRVVPGNVLITIAGRLGTTAVFPEDLVEGNITGHIAGIELREGISPDYVTTVINSRFGEFQVERLGQRTTRPELNLHEVRQILLPLPPRPIQDRIVQVIQEAYIAKQGNLTQADNEISKSEEVLENHLGIRPPNSQADEAFVVKVRDLTSRMDVHYHLPEFVRKANALKTNRHPLIKVGDLADGIFNGATPKANGSDYTESSIEGVPFIRITDIKNYTVDMSNILYIHQQVHEGALRRSQIKPGDVLLSMAGTIGLAAVVPEGIRKANINQALAAIRPKEVVLPSYLEIFLNSWIGRAQTLRLSRPVVQANINLSDIRRILIPILPGELQQKIIDEVQIRRSNAQTLRFEAENIVKEAKARVERMILGEQE